MHSYQEHQRLAALLHELSGTIAAQSERLLEISRERRMSGKLSGSSVLHQTGPHLGTAFELLASHAQTLHDELERLEMNDLCLAPLAEPCVSVA
jgi:hypothetical protein